MRNKMCRESEEIRSEKQAAVEMWNLSWPLSLKISALLFIFSPWALIWAGVQLLRDLKGSKSGWCAVEKPMQRFAELLAAALGNMSEESERKK